MSAKAINLKRLWDEYYGDTSYLNPVKYNTPFEKPVRFLTYSENGVSSNVKYKTYQEMATAMILCWESSANHRCAQRAPLFDKFSYKKYGDKNVIIKSQSACCVRYAHGKLWAFINFIY